MSYKSLNKRNKGRAAQALLARLVAFAEQSSADIDGPTRRLLVDLLNAGPYVVVSDARHEIVGTAPNEVRPWSSGNVEELRNTLRVLFRSLVSGGEDEGQLVPTLTVERVEFGIAAARSHAVVTIDGAARNLIRFQLVELLQRTGLERLLRCVCGKVFAKTGRREFCSERCQKRIYMRNQRHQERQQREKRHGKTTRTR